MPAQLYVMGLIDEASHVLMARYRQQFDPDVMTDALDWFLRAGRAASSWTRCCWPLWSSFPDSSVYRGEQTARAMAGRLHRRHVRTAPPRSKRLMLLWMANRNQAFRPFEELFEDSALAEKTVYRQVAAAIAGLLCHPAAGARRRRRAGEPAGPAARAGRLGSRLARASSSP